MREDLKIKKLPLISEVEYAENGRSNRTRGVMYRFITIQGDNN